MSSLCSEKTICFDIILWILYIYDVSYSTSRRAYILYNSMYYVLETACNVRTCVSTICNIRTFLAIRLEMYNVRRISRTLTPVQMYNVRRISHTLTPVQMYNARLTPCNVHSTRYVIVVSTAYQSYIVHTTYDARRGTSPCRRTFHVHRMGTYVCGVRAYVNCVVLGFIRE